MTSLAARLTLAGAATLLVGGACSIAAPPTATTSELAPPTAVLTLPPETTTSTTEPLPASDVTSTTRRTTVASTVAGSLPDGTAYEVIIEPARQIEIEDVSAAVMLDDDDGASQFLGVATFRVGEPASGEITFENGHLSVPGVRGLVTIAVSDGALESLGPAAQEVLVGSVTRLSGVGAPALALEPPLRWATDHEIPLQMEVDYGFFVVRRGCLRDLAVACNHTGAVQVIPKEAVFSGAPRWPDVEIRVESSAPRPPENAHYLDLGPLPPRGGPSVIWTGEEMIVWGGATSDRPPDLVDGAAFDPATSTWRLLPTAPLREGQTNRAVWAGHRMLVVGTDATAAYHPETDDWDLVADGIAPPRWHDLMIWTGDIVALWNTGGLHVLDEDAGIWERIDDPGFGNAQPWQTALRAVDGKLVVVGLRSGNCSGRHVALWDGNTWEQLPDVELVSEDFADCSYPHQMAATGGQLFVWEDAEHPTRAFDRARGTWEEFSEIPLSGTEAPAGPVAMGDRFLVPQYGDGAIYEPGVDVWSSVTLPGGGLPRHMVWTGEEVLMWGDECCYGGGSGPFTIDAWRWTPPQR